MAQATVLADGTTAATSTDITVASGATVTVGIFSSAATGIPANVGAAIFLDTPGDDAFYCFLNGLKQFEALTKPGTYRVKRPVVTTSIGVFTE